MAAADVKAAIRNVPRKISDRLDEKAVKQGGLEGYHLVNRRVLC